MKSKSGRIGLRAFEIEAGLAENVAPESTELVEYEATRAVGQAARMSMLIRGLVEIEDETRLKKIAAHELKIAGVGAYDAVKRVLLEADLLRERVTPTGKRVLYENVHTLDHTGDFERLGDVWASKQRSEKEIVLVETLNQVVDGPVHRTEIDALESLDAEDRAAVLEVATNACIVDTLDTSADPVLFSPLLFFGDPATLRKVMSVTSASAFRSLMAQIARKPGTDVTTVTDPILIQAIRAGALPTFRVRSTGGERAYSFTPYTGALINTVAQRSVIEKALAIVACLRYGMEAATITRIGSALAILDALLDPQRHRVGPHSELKTQYGTLVGKVGRIIQSGSKYYFKLDATEDNLLACRIAKELISHGEVVREKETTTDPRALASGSVNYPVTEVRVAKQKKLARADELAGLVEKLRGV